MLFRWFIRIPPLLLLALALSTWVGSHYRWLSLDFDFPGHHLYLDAAGGSVRSGLERNGNTGFRCTWWTSHDDDPENWATGYPWFCGFKVVLRNYPGDTRWVGAAAPSWFVALVLAMLSLAVWFLTRRNLSARHAFPVELKGSREPGTAGAPVPILGKPAAKAVATASGTEV